MNYTTLNKIRSFEPCRPSWTRLLESLNKTQADDEPLAYDYILDTLGVQDAIWALRTYDDVKGVKIFACDCAERSLQFWDAKYPNDKRPHEAIKAARDYIGGKINLDKLIEKHRAAYAYAAADAAYARKQELKWQANHYREMFCK